MRGTYIMKKQIVSVVLTTFIIGSLLSACGSTNDKDIDNAADQNMPPTSIETNTDNSTDKGTTPTEDLDSNKEADSNAKEDSTHNNTTSNEQKPSNDKKPGTEQTPDKQKPDNTKEPSKDKPSVKDPVSESLPSAKEMVDEMLKQIEQPIIAEMESDMIKDSYYIDPELLEEFAIRYSMISIKSNEVAILKVKDAKNIDTVKEGIKKRAEDIQKQFEWYLPDQYENAQNYRIVTNGNYILFVISESADDLEKAFATFFENK